MPHIRAKLATGLTLGLALGGCSRENPAFSLSGHGSGGTDGSGSSSDSGATDTGAPTSDGSGSASNSATATSDASTSQGVTSEPATSGPGSTGAVSSSTGTDTTGTSSSSSGGPNECMDGVVGEPPRLEVKKDGQPLVACGMAKSLTKTFAKFSGSTLQLHDSGTCNQSGTLYELTGVNFSITPQDLGDGCFDARIEWAPGPVCEVTGFGLRNGDQPIYVGAFGRLRGPTGYTAFASEPLFDCGCAVDGVECCDHVSEVDQKLYEPGVYTLAFPGADSDIAAGAQITGTVDGSSYLFRNLRSHVGPSCDPAPTNVWLDVRWWAMNSN